MIPEQDAEIEELLSLREFILYIFDPYSADFGNYSSDLALLLHYGLIKHREKEGS